MAKGVWGHDGRCVFILHNGRAKGGLGYDDRCVLHVHNGMAKGELAHDGRCVLHVHNGMAKGDRRCLFGMRLVLCRALIIIANNWLCLCDFR